MVCRLYVLHRLPTLKFLDSSGVRRSEVREAKKRGPLARTVRLSPTRSSTQTKMKAVEDGHLPPLDGNRKAKRLLGDKRMLNGSPGSQVLTETNSSEMSGIHTGEDVMATIHMKVRQSQQPGPERGA